MSDDLEYVRRAVALRDSVEAAFRNYLDGSGFDAKQLAVEVTKLLDDRKVLQAEVDRLTKLLPRCLGEWVSGSGGHRKYTGGCSNPGVWDVGLGFVCDAHKNKNGGDDDAWRWEEEEERLRSENDRLSKALVGACTTVEQRLRQRTTPADYRLARAASPIRPISPRARPGSRLDPVEGHRRLHGRSLPLRCPRPCRRELRVLLQVPRVRGHVRGRADRAALRARRGVCEATSGRAACRGRRHRRCRGWRRR